VTSRLRLASVSAGYGARPVLHGVSLEVQEGQLWALLGPNGAGKSTVVKVALGLLPAQGEVSVCGMEPRTASRGQVAKQVAWVPQSPADEGAAFTGLELALMGRSPHLGAWGLPSAADHTRAQQALDALGVAALAQRPLTEASGGERRLVWLARALVQEPKLLLLDEPTAFLDVRHQVAVLKHVRQKVSEGLAALAVLHDVNQAAAWATHVALLKDGRVQAAGPAMEVLTAERLTALYEVPVEALAATGRTFFALTEGAK
jgi:iron complex transport system ATP-binding protein